MTELDLGLAPLTAVAASHPLDYPRLRHCTFVDFGKDLPLKMVVGSEYFDITEQFGTRDTFFNVKRYLDGRHTIAEIMFRTGVGQEYVVAIVEAFHDLGLMQRRGEVEMIPTDEFLQQVEASCVMWARQINYHELFSGLVEHRLRPEIFLGMLIETYHHVHSAPVHVGTAIGSATIPRHREILARYFIEEHDHGRLFVETLSRLGMDPAQVRAAHPIIASMSMLHMLCAIARSGSFNYLTSTALFEARADEVEESEASMRRIATSYGFDPGALDPILEHMHLDVAAGHAGLLAEAMKGQRYVSADAAHQAVNWMHDLKHSFDQVHDGIVQYYGDVANYIPRLTVDYFSL
jgi:pyrroloquinoline quinone (PQQ) biosynthesis protein C